MVKDFATFGQDLEKELKKQLEETAFANEEDHKRGIEIFKNRLPDLKQAYDGLGLSMNLAAEDLPSYSKELGVIRDKWYEIGTKIGDGTHESFDGLGELFAEVGELMRRCSDHHFKVENFKKLDGIRGQMRANFYELTETLKKIKLFV